MPHADDRQRRSILQRIAHRVMLERGLVPDFPLPALAELDAIHGSATRVEESTRDLRNLPWCSIDNDDSHDLDQLTVAEAIPDGATKVLVATADVDTVVKKRSGLDDHPLVEGRLVRGFEGMDVGHRLSVQLIHTDVDRAISSSRGKRSNKRQSYPQTL
jgi:hypothetical protein